MFGYILISEMWFCCNYPSIYSFACLCQYSKINIINKDVMEISIAGREYNGTVGKAIPTYAGILSLSSSSQRQPTVQQCLVCILK